MRQSLVVALTIALASVTLTSAIAQSQSGTQSTSGGVGVGLEKGTQTMHPPRLEAIPQSRGGPVTLGTLPRMEPCWSESQPECRTMPSPAKKEMLELFDACVFREELPACSKMREVGEKLTEKLYPNERKEFSHVPMAVYITEIRLIREQALSREVGCLFGWCISLRPQHR